MAYFCLNFESQYLRGNTEVGIIMPDVPFSEDTEKFYKEAGKFKVLWLLHGTFGDHTDWLRMSNIELYARENNLVVVMPAGLNASYTNWEGFGIGYLFEDYFIHELMPLIYHWLPVSDKREDNYIAGLSMGGLGTLKFALTHPQCFTAAAVLSASPHHYEYELEQEAYKKNQRYKNMFANAGGYEEFLRSDDNVWRLAHEAVERKDIPKILITEGEEDQFFPVFAHFREEAEKIGFEADFETIPGYQHEWRFWEIAILHALKFFGFCVQEEKR